MPPVIDILNNKSFVDKRIFLMCGGHSLRGFNFTPLLDEITIGINKSFVDFPNTTYNFSLDSSFYNILHQDKDLLGKWKAYRGIKIFAIRKKSEKFPKDIYTVLVSRRYKHGKDFISLDIKQKINCGCNSAFCAMMFVIACGCREIYFLGLDLSLGPEGQTHHHSGYPNQSVFKFETGLNTMKSEFMEFAPLIMKLGIEVINLNPDSALRCFPFNELKNILENSNF